METLASVVLQWPPPYVVDHHVFTSCSARVTAGETNTALGRWSMSRSCPTDFSQSLSMLKRASVTWQMSSACPPLVILAGVVSPHDHLFVEWTGQSIAPLYHGMIVTDLPGTDPMVKVWGSCLDERMDTRYNKMLIWPIIVWLLGDTGIKLSGTIKSPGFMFTKLKWQLTDFYTAWPYRAVIVLKILFTSLRLDKGVVVLQRS